MKIPRGGKSGEKKTDKNIFPSGAHQTFQQKFYRQEKHNMLKIDQKLQV